MSDNITIKIDENGDAIAFIHDAPVYCKQGVLSYQHIGQHSDAHKDYMTSACFYPRTTQDVIKAYALVMELKSIGYDIGE